MVPMREFESALAVIQQAIYNEITGQRFYSDASFYCLDPWAKDLFATLAREEEGHTQLLLIEYQSLETTGEWIDPHVALLSDTQVDITRFTFPDDEPAQELFPSQWSVNQAVDRRADDLAALAFGIHMEKRAIALYGEQLEGNVDAVAQEAYRFLVEEERRHYGQLKDQWERLAGMPFEDA
jgi:rubrerythrin